MTAVYFYVAFSLIRDNALLHLLWLMTTAVLVSLLFFLVLRSLGLDAVHAAAMAGDIDGLKRILASGADPDLSDPTGQTPLIAAALEGEAAAAALLIERGADVDARTGNGLTALHAAAYAGEAGVASLLLGHGAAVNDHDNRFGITPLHAAAEENRGAVVELLLAARADPGLTEANGYTPATRAGWREHWDIVTALKRAGAVCQPEELVGAWLYEKCTEIKP